MDDATHMLASCASVKPAEMRAALEKRHHCAVLPKDVYNLKQKLKGSSTDASDCDVLLCQIVTDGGFVEFANKSSK